MRWRDENHRRIRILVAGEECPLLREGLKSVVTDGGFDVVAETHGFEHVFSLVSATGPDVALLVSLNDSLPVVDVIRGVGRLAPDCKSVCLLSSAKHRLNAVPLAAKSEVPCLPVTSAPEEIVSTIRRAARQGDGILNESGAPDGEQLTSREMEVLDVLGRGSCNKEIAQKLFVTTATVKAHLTSVYRKLGVGSRAEAVALYRSL